MTCSRARLMATVLLAAWPARLAAGRDSTWTTSTPPITFPASGWPWPSTSTRGVLYPPLESDGCYAGTRYSPLFFILIAGLAWVTPSYLVAAKLAAASFRGRCCSAASPRPSGRDRPLDTRLPFWPPCCWPFPRDWRRAAAARRRPGSRPGRLGPGRSCDRSRRQLRIWPGPPCCSPWRS